MADPIRDLIQALETAPEGSRALSDRVLEALGWSVRLSGLGGFAYVMRPGGREAELLGDERPDPTRSLDDVAALVDWHGRRLCVDQDLDGPRWHVILTEGFTVLASSEAATLPLAVSAVVVLTASDTTLTQPSGAPPKTERDQGVSL